MDNESVTYFGCATNPEVSGRNRHGILAIYRNAGKPKRQEWTGEYFGTLQAAADRTGELNTEIARKTTWIKYDYTSMGAL